MNVDLANKYLDIEKKKLLIVIDKRGIEGEIINAVLTSKENSVNFYEDRYSVDYLDSKQKADIGLEYDKQNKENVKILLIDRENKPIFATDTETSDTFENSISNMISFYCNATHEIKVGSTITLFLFSKITYRITEIKKHRGIIKMPTYTAMRD